MLDKIKLHWLIGTPYLSIIVSNEICLCVCHTVCWLAIEMVTSFSHLHLQVHSSHRDREENTHLVRKFGFTKDFCTSCKRYTRYTPGTRYTSPGTRYTPQYQVPAQPGTHPPGPGTPPLGPGTPPQDQVPPMTRYTPPRTRYTPGTRYTPPGPGAPLGPGTPSRPGTPPDQVHPPWPGTPPWDQIHPLPEQCMPGDMGNKLAVRILLECILVQYHKKYQKRKNYTIQSIAPKVMTPGSWILRHWG